ncbi:tRNA-cytidine(32) 2-sulfurtransferase [Frankliniella fusca]|uniref:tRNA-cytidine(32) 2-sulfurtransferase n=1 Tax=Frankliniella fusca TaxID=407009 RepID=A0AAE1LMN7_9NEOP|nr:tRNA-cytidine(32) 2-sulfurtransferase [Frankliniella fusca]
MWGPAQCAVMLSRCLCLLGLTPRGMFVAVVYCDYTASGRSLQFIEDYILHEVLPCYGNTHTTTSITSLQSTLFRHEARDIIRNAVNASEHDVVIFAGSGCTGAVHKLIQALSLTEAPVVFVGPCEHHSNLLPWREVGAQIVRIAETPEGFLDLQDLELQLQTFQASGRQLIGCFSAASNITGIVTDDVATTLLLHQYNALAFWDYATAAPYVKLDMNPNVPGVSEQSVHKDAIFFSMHKFVGGVQTPGILVAKKSLFRNSVPNGCGGGSVFFVTQGGHRYLKDTEMREEGGTGAIVESVRAGLVMQLKEAVGHPNIMAREEKICKMVLAHIRTIPELILLGNNSSSIQRLPVFSFMVRHPRGTFLHHNFVCAVLNDVFGIQVRGGCACAGPYAQDLLGISEELAADYEAVLMEDSRLDRTHLRRKGEHSTYEMLRPGFARVSIPYFMSDSEIAFVLEALKMVATEGWKLLPQYILNPDTGEWRHNTNTVFRDRKWLGSIRYVDGKMQCFERRVSGQSPCPHDTGDCLHTARNIFNKARKMAQRYPLPDQRLMFDEHTAALRWFMLPSEAQDLLLGNVQNVKQEVPFDPTPYSGARGRTASCDSASSGETTPGVQHTSPTSNGSTPPKCPLPTSFARHNSLSSIDNLPKFVGSPNAPLQTRTRINSLQVPLQWVPPQSDSVGPLSPLSPLRFCIGDPVHPSSPPLGTNADYFSSLARMRCNSLGSPMSCSDVNAPISSVQSSCSCGSQVDLNSIDKDFYSLPPYSAQMSTTSLDGSVCSNSSPNSDGLSAYVQEVTKELATEIKSEIREVISQVEDVLSDSTEISSTNGSAERLHSSSRLRCDSVSAEHVAEYLTDKGKDLVSEMKTEIRGMVDGLMSPDKSPIISPIVKDVPKKLLFKTSKRGTAADPSPDKTISEDSSEETVVHTLAGQEISQSKDNSDADEEFDTTDSITDGIRQSNLDEVKSLDTRVNSISSQDSGINLLCSESEKKGGTKHKKKISKDCVPCRKKSVCKRDEPKEMCSEEDSDATKPECSPCTSESENDSKNRDHCFSCTKNEVSGKEKKRSVIRVDGISKVTLEETVEGKNNPSSKRRSFCTSGNGSAFTCPKDDEDVVKKACALRRSSRAGVSEVENKKPDKKPVSEERLRSKGGWHCPPKNIWKPTMEAIDEFGMIRDGDKVMVCLSGGKDSLSLLHTLRQYQFYARTKGINFTFGAATVDPGSTAYDPKPLIPYLASLGVHYLYEEQSILDQALENGCSSVCSFCSRMKRGRLYAAARANGYNVLALGQHLDDLAESFLMSTFHNGRLRTMKAHYHIKERDLRVIRPFVYVREKSLRQFAESKGLPIIAENCPACFEAPKERHRTKQLLAQQEILFPKIFWSLRSSLHPLLSFRYTGQEGAVYSKNRRRSSSGVDPPGSAPPQDGSDTEEEPIS